MKLLGLKPYFDCKDSGMQWLGEVPKHWGFDSVKRHYKIQLGKIAEQAAIVFFLDQADRRIRRYIHSKQS